MRFLVVSLVLKAPFVRNLFPALENGKYFLFTFRKYAKSSAAAALTFARFESR